MYVYPAYPDSFGTTLLGAMSYGVPVVAANLPSYREFTRGNAILLPYREEDEWPENVYQSWAYSIVNLL